MSLPRYRLRTLMLAVAAVAVALAGLNLMRRSASYTARAERHRAQGSFYVSLAARATRAGRRIDADRYGANAVFHERMRARYAYAASHPWLPVASELSEPE
jgi:hypothetical protein